MTDLYAKIKSICTHSHRGRGSYAKWSESYSNSFEYVSLEKDEFGVDKVPVDFEVSEGDIVYIVWAEWSSGDSFGRSDSGQSEVVHIFKDADLAFECLEILKKNQSKHDPYLGREVSFKTDSGKEINYYRPWFGYFESLSGIHLETSKVLTKKVEEHYYV